MIKLADKEYRPLELEARVREFWARTKAYEKTRRRLASGRDFYFADGPPYTTGSIHLGQVLNKTLKDAVLRRLRMLGYNVRDQPGYDMHGLPIEVQVEKALGITNKKEIDNLGIERFVQTCREFSTDLLKQMSAQFVELGVWMDWDRPYLTITNDYIAATWAAIAKAHERKLLYEALRSTHWCARCQTALAEAEIEHSEEVDPSIYVLFPLRDRPKESLVIWTTTPWTLPANMAVAVHPTFRYAKVRVSEDFERFLWIMEDAVRDVMKAAAIPKYEIVDRIEGRGMQGWSYDHPLASRVPLQGKLKEPAHTVVPSETVVAEHTGLVHSAPGHGPEDFELGQKHGLPIVSPVDEGGHFTPDAGDYAGMHVREANARIIEDLKRAGALLAATTIAHAYGHCPRCKTPIIFRATTQWFLGTTQLRGRMFEEIARVRWYPDWAGSARQKDWVQNLRDWCISRQRYWGAPLPVWRCSECGALRVVGRPDELRGARGYSEGMDLHRPRIDEVVLPCPKCGFNMARVKDVLDVWFDSGVASWAPLGYPASESEWRRWWPAKWIVEGPDQTRGWFHSQMCAGLITFDRAPYDSVTMHGWVNGPDGRAMHKSLGNAIEPSTVIAKSGVDALRFYLLSVNAPWEDKTFQEEGVRTSQRTLNILWNVHRFATTYMSMDPFDPARHSLEAVRAALRPEDRWILSRLEELKASVDLEFDAYSVHRAARALESFVLDDLSRWYVRIVRDRTWSEREDGSKFAAYAVLHECLLTVAQLLSPLVPYVAEAVYQDLGGERLTIAMSPWPKVHEDRMDRDLEAAMATVREIVEGVSKVRQSRSKKLRWPVARIAVRTDSEPVRKAVASLRDILLAQANAKDVTLLSPGEDVPGTRLVLHANATAIGRVYKGWLPRIVSLLEKRPPKEVQRALAKGEYKVGVDGQPVAIEPSMVTFERVLPEDIASTATAAGEVFVDLRLTPELEAEGFARELVRRIQQMRKETDLDVADYIRGAVKLRRELAEAVETWRPFIARETRARSLAFVDDASREEYVVEWPIEGETVMIGITPLDMADALRQFTRIPGITEKKATALFAAGYKTLAALREASRDELAGVEGLDTLDIRRIREFLDRAPESQQTCAVCGGVLSAEQRTCPRCEEPVGAPAAAQAAPTTPPRPEPHVPPRTPTVATLPPQAGLPELHTASTYLVLELQNEGAYRLFHDALERGRKGFAVTRSMPQKVQQKFGLTCPMVWLSNVGKGDTIRPKDIEKLSLVIEQFLAKNEGAVVLIDGVEYLVTNNNFLTVLRLLQSVRDRVAIHGATLLFPLNPATLDSNQLNLLEREVDAVLDMRV